MRNLQRRNLPDSTARVKGMRFVHSFLTQMCLDNNIYKRGRFVLNQKEIARLAGVSVATVSRVINNDANVSEKTRDKVRNILAQQSYVTNINARNLRTARTKTIGYLISTFNNPYFVSVYEGLEKICKEHGYTILIGITNEDPKTQLEAIDMLLSYKVCGIVGSFVTPDNITIKKMKKMCDFVISLDRSVPGLNADLICVNNEFGGAEQVRHAVEYGHERIAVIYGKEDSVGIGRLKGYKQCMEHYGCKIRPEYMVPGEFNETVAYLSTLSLLTLPEPPTVILAHNNLMTIGAFKAIKDMHLSIPDDISLIGFDDFSLADYLSPGLTIIQHPAYEMGEIAAKTLFDRLSGKYTGEQKNVMLPVKLEIRGSCKVIGK